MLMPKEEVEQIALCNWLRLNRIDFFAPMNENSHSAKDKKMAVILEVKAQRMGKKKGTSDLFIFLDNCLLIIELKRKPTTLKSGKTSYSNSKVSQEQLDFIEMANKYLYAKAYVCYGYEEAIKIIEELR